MKTSKKLILIFVSCLYMLSTGVSADKRWYLSASINGQAGQYSDSTLKDSFVRGDALINIDSLDDYGFTIAYSDMTIGFKDVGAGEYNITQQALAGRYQYHIFNDPLAGKVTVQLVVHDVTNDSRTTFANDILVIAPKLSYLHYDKDLYLDFEYVNSDYSTRIDFSIQQISSSIGFGFNKNNDWLQLRATLITSSNKLLSQGEDSLTSLSLRWKHLFSPRALFSMDSFYIDVLTGERVFAVDNDAFSVNNLEAVQQSSAVLGVGWRPGEDFDISLIAGVENYKNKLIINTYKREYLYLGLTKHW